MGQIGMDISVEELRRQHQEAVEAIARQRAEIERLQKNIGEIATANAELGNLIIDYQQTIQALERVRDQLNTQVRQLLERATERDNLRWRLQEEQTTIRALEDVCVKHGYDKETGECLTDWLEEELGGHHALERAIQQDQKIEQLQDAVDHWKKKYNEKNEELTRKDESGGMIEATLEAARQSLQPKEEKKPCEGCDDECPSGCKLVCGQCQVNYFCHYCVDDSAPVCRAYPLLLMANEKLVKEEKKS